MANTLTLTTESDLKKELGLGGSPSQATPAVTNVDSSIDAKADAMVNELLNFNMDQTEKVEERKNAVENMGSDIQKQASEQSQLLKQPIRLLSERGAEGGPVANALVDLKLKIEDLDPSKFDLQPGWFARTVGMLPGVGSPLKRYFTKFESAQSVISAIVQSLEKGRDQLLRDNFTLTEDQKKMRAMTQKLDQAISLGAIMDQKFQYKLEREVLPTDPKHKFISEEILFPLRQRIIDLQQQLAVNQQGVLASEIIIRNNKELARGVDRALNVTINALQVGATVAMALANQKIVLDKVNAVNQTTNDLIRKTAEQLKIQGSAIHQQAASSQLSVDALKAAFADINTAMQNVSEFRSKALPQMASTIIELDRLSKEAEGSIKKMESGNKSVPTIKIEA